MTAELVFVGTEILLGNIVNTNGAYLAERLAMLGVDSYYQSVVGDNAERLMGVLKIAFERSDVVILSGGLGPTQDDITKETVASYFGKELQLDEGVKAEIAAYFEKRGRQMAENNIKQAMVPDGAKILHNANGTAPGILMEEGNKTAILLPGPPAELKAMFEEQVEPWLKARTGGMLYSAVVKVCGISESRVAEILDDMISASGAVTVAPYAKTGEVHLRVTARGEDEKAAKKLVKPVVKEIKARLGSLVYTTHEEVTLEQAVVDLLLANKLTVTTVESCTGGLIAGRLINVPGVSEVFKAGLVTYSNKAKKRIVGVKKQTLQKHGAVSEETVYEMVKGAAFFSRADVAVAVSGIAGPDGGTAEKPVGLVYIGCYVCGEVTVKEYHFSGNREKVRQNTVTEALILMRDCMLKNYAEKTFKKSE